MKFYLAPNLVAIAVLYALVEMKWGPIARTLKPALHARLGLTLEKR